MALAACVSAPGYAQGWSNPILLQQPGEAMKTPKIAAASGGGFHAVYKVTGDPWRNTYRRYQNGNLSQPVYIPHSGWPGGNADVVEAHDGSIWYTWENWADIQQIWASRSTNGGNTWTGYQVTNYAYGPDQGGWAKHPSIAPYGPAGSPTVLSVTWNANSKELMSAAFNGTTWGPNTGNGTIVDNAYATYGVCTSPQDGSIFRIYGRRIGGIWQACYRRFNGTAWEPEVIISDHTNDQFLARPAIAVNSRGHIMAAWERNEIVWGRHYTPQSGWGPTQILAYGGFSSVTHVPGRPDFMIAYCRTGNAYAKRFVSNWWGPEELLSKGLPNAFTVDSDITADKDGYVYAVYETHPANGPLAYFNVHNEFVWNDNTPPPSVAPVTDEGAQTDSTTDLAFGWLSVNDPESGIDRYEYIIGTTPGGHDVRYWTHAGWGNSHVAHGLALTPGVTYYISVRAVNKKGLEGPMATSDGILCNPTINSVFWGSTFTVSTSGGACDTPMLFPASDGGMHLSYRDMANNRFRVAYRKMLNDVWFSTEMADNDTVAVYFPDLLEDSSGTVRIFFSNPGGRESNDIYEVVRQGSNWWSSPARLTTGQIFNWYHKVAPGSGNRLVELIGHGNDFTYNVKNMTRTTAGWGQVADIGTNPWQSARYGIPDIINAPNGDMLAVWIGPGNTVRFARKTGTVWSTPVNIASFASGFMVYPRIAVGPNGLAHIVYTDNNVAPDPAVYYQQQTSSGWTQPSLIANGNNPAIAVDKNNRPHVVYAKGGGGQWDIFHKTFAGFSWSVERNISNNGGTSERPTLRLDKNGDLHVAWQDNSFGATRILYRKSLGKPIEIGAVFSKADGTSVDLYGKVVTGVFPAENSVYVQEMDRSSGIRLVAPAGDLAPGDVVWATGTLGTRVISGQPSQRQVNSAQISRITRGPAPEPLHMQSLALVGQAPTASVVGARDAVGAYNMGMLASITGRVTLKISNLIYVDDGAGIPDIPGRTGVMVRCPSTSIPVEVGDIVNITGIIEGSVPTGWTANRRHIQIRSWSDLKKLN